MAELLRVERCPTGLSLVGEVDASTAPLLDEAIAACLSAATSAAPFSSHSSATSAAPSSSTSAAPSAHLASGPPMLHLTMDGVTFMDSTGLRVLLQATDTARAMGGDVVLLDPAAPVRRVVEVAGLEGHFTLRSSEPGAGPGTGLDTESTGGPTFRVDQTEPSL